MQLTRLFRKLLARSGAKAIEMREIGICVVCDRIIIRGIEYPSLWGSPRRDGIVGSFGACRPKNGSVVVLNLARLARFNR